MEIKQIATRMESEVLYLRALVQLEHGNEESLYSMHLHHHETQWPVETHDKIILNSISLCRSLVVLVSMTKDCKRASSTNEIFKLVHRMSPIGRD